MIGLLKVDSLKKVLLHLGVILVLFMGLLFFFFYVYLPNATHHDQTITVPRIVGMKTDELESYLKAKKLRYKINDSTYSAGMKPNTVLTQHPLPDTKVKENRMIYITVAAKNPPKVAMPNLKDASLKGAEIQLSQHGLVRGQIIFVPGKPDMVYDQLIGNHSVDPGTMIAKGTKINLKVGNSAEEIPVPDFTGMSVADAKKMAEEHGVILEVQTPHALPNDDIRRQKPSPNEVSTMKTGETVDVWTE